MPRGGKRIGAGRKAGSPTRPKIEIEKEQAYRAMKAAARAAKREARANHDAAKAEAREARAKGENRPARMEILPPMNFLQVPLNVEPLDFLKLLMRDDRLPIGFRRDCAALALPYAHPKPILGLKDARYLAAMDDDGEDDIAAAMRA